MSGIFTKMRSIPVHYPLIRGMISYSIIWPTCSIIQEYLDHGATLEEANLARAARFGIFGSLFMAPVFYGWMKFSGRFFKSKTLKTAILRAAVEQVSYSPLAMVYFFFGMSLLEFKPLNVCWNEVKEKFWPTYKMGIIFWPTAQTFNFYCVSEKNRVVFVSIASLIWTTYLAHMKGKEQKNLMPDLNINVLKMSDTLTSYKVVVQSDNLVDKKDQPLKSASDNPNDSDKSNLKKKSEAALSVAPKDQVVSESDSNKIAISNPVGLKKDPTLPMATAPVVSPSILDKILPASPITKIPVKSETHADKLPDSTIIIEPATPIVTETVSNSTPVENDSNKNMNEHSIIFENTNPSNERATDLYEQSIDTGLSDHKVDNLSTALLSVGLDTNLITPKVDAAVLTKIPDLGDEDKPGGFSADDGKTTDHSLSDGKTTDHSLSELPIPDEEILKIID